jgi:hypothetical protein
MRQATSAGLLTVDRLAIHKSLPTSRILDTPSGCVKDSIR